MAGHFRKKSSSIVLTPALEKRAGEIADAFFDAADRDIVITDGVRTPASRPCRFMQKSRLTT